MKVTFEELVEEIEYLQDELEKFESVMENTSDHIEYDRLKLYTKDLECQIMSYKSMLFAK